MLTEPTNRTAAKEVLLAAMAVERGDSAEGVEALPSELESLAEALRVADGALVGAASQVVPAADPSDQGVCSRYQRAAATWPIAPPPSHEAFAGTLARLHDAADATRQAARRCDDARRAVQALLPTSQSAHSS
jgi:hypothetical protein